MKASIKVRVQDWNGFSEEQPAFSEFVTEVATGEHLEQYFPHNFHQVVVLARLITKEVVFLQTWRLAPKQEGGGIDLMSNFSGLQVRFKKNQVASLSTQTMDGGSTFTFTLLDIME